MKVINYILLLVIGLIIALVFGWRGKGKRQEETTSASMQPAQIGGIRKTKPSATKGLQAGTSIEELRMKVPTLFEYPTIVPEFAVLQKLTKPDEEALITHYQQQTNLFHRISTIWALAYIGDEKTFELFKRTLTSEFAGQVITSKSHGEDTDEEAVMLMIVSAMGLLSQHNPSAFYFLKQGTDAWSWHDKVLWSSNRGKDTYGLLTSMSIMGVANSGRAEFSVILEELKTGPLINPIGGVHPNDRNIAGAIVDSAFNYYLAKKLPYDELFKLQLTPQLRGNARQEWESTDEGQSWLNWYNQVHGFPPVSKQQNRLKIVN